MDNLVWFSPRTGGAVSRSAGEPYADRLIKLPEFLCDDGLLLQAGIVTQLRKLIN
ncbi:MAG: hypothetical protein Q8M31_23150 [Beijerinckiaceae bacterium]|nr:hypothetical protein [Beijerinckiaceae bacterium]